MGHRAPLWVWGGEGFSRGPPNAYPPTGPSLLPTPLCGGLGGQVCGNPDHSSHWTRRESPKDCAFKSLGEMTPFSRLKSASKDSSVSPNGVEIWQPSPHRIQRTEQLAGGLGFLVPRGKWMLSLRTVLCLKNSMDSPRFESSHTWPPSDQSGRSCLQFFSCLTKDLTKTGFHSKGIITIFSKKEQSEELQVQGWLI